MAWFVFRWFYAAAGIFLSVVPNKELAMKLKVYAPYMYYIQIGVNLILLLFGILIFLNETGPE